jgi:hypothetical protein
MFSLKLRVDQLKSMGKDVKVDPHFLLFRDSQDFQQKLYHSEVQKNVGGSVQFRLFTFGVGSKKSLTTALKIEFWDKKTFFGQIEVCLLIFNIITVYHFRIEIRGHSIHCQRSNVSFGRKRNCHIHEIRGKNLVI